MQLRVNGSERIQDPAEKMKRIQELAGIKKETVKESSTNSTPLYNVDAADGNNYALVQEGANVFMKKLVNENYEYMSGLKNKTEYKYTSLAEGLKHLNLLLKNINSEVGNVEGTELLKKK